MIKNRYDTKGDTGMTQDINTDNKQQYMYLDGGVYKLRLPSKGKDVSGKRINGIRTSLQTSDLKEAKFIVQSLSFKYSVADLNGFTNDRLHEIIMQAKADYIEHCKHSILICAMKLNDISEDYKTVLGFYGDSLKVDDTDLRINLEQNIGLQVQSLIKDIKELNSRLEAFNGKTIDDLENVNYLSSMSREFAKYYQDYISMKKAFETTCIRDSALQVYHDQINKECSLELTNQINTSNQQISSIKQEPVTTSNSTTEQITLSDVIENALADKDIVHPDVFKGNVLRAFKHVGLTEQDILDPLKIKEYLRKIKQGLAASKSIKAKSSFKHYKSAMTSVLNALIDLSEDSNALHILIKAKNTVETTWKGGRFEDSIPYDPFDETMLKSIFNPEHEFFKDKPWDFWACVLALYVGSRSNMAHTLKYSDITNVVGIDIVNFIDYEQDKAKKKKNNATKRLVPIHSELLDLGFLDFIKNKQKHDNASDSDYVFSELIDSDGHLKPNINDDFLKFLKEIGIKTDKDKELGINYAFHSFRVTAAQRMEECGLKPGEVNGLIGWAGPTTRDHYQSRARTTQTKDLQKANKKLNYDFLKSELSYWKEYWAKYYNNK